MGVSTDLHEIALRHDPETPGGLAQGVVERPRVGPFVALVRRRAALQRHAPGVVADPLDLGELVVGQRLSGQRGQLLPLELDGLRVGTRLLDQRGHDAGNGGLGERPLARELQQREAVAIRDGAHEVEPLAPGRDPARRPEQTMIRTHEHRLVEQRIVEEPAVVDDPGKHPHVVLGAGGQGEPGGPGLERVQDQHGPVDQRPEALEAGDDVEGEAVRGAGSHADRVGETLVPQRGHRVPDLGRGVADAVRVVQEEEIEALDSAALEARLGGAPQVRAVGSRASQPGIGEARVAARAVTLAVDEVVADGTDETERRAIEAGDRPPDEPIGLSLAVDVGRHDGADPIVRARSETRRSSSSVTP